MRMPVSKVYRAFPELDHFSDRQCESHFDKVRKKYRLQETGFTLLTVVGMLVVGLLVVVSGRLVLQAVFPPPGNPPPAAILAVVGFLAFSLLLQCVVVLRFRDRWLFRTLRRHLEDTRCGKCEYQLLGLPVKEAAVTCPECGERHTLVSLGRTEADFAMRPVG